MNNASQELSLAIARWQKDNACDYATALKQYSATPRGERVWRDYLQQEEQETITLSDANVTNKLVAHLRRLKAEPHTDGKSIAIKDLVTGEDVGMPLSRHHVEAVLDALDGKGPRMLTDLERHREIGRAVMSFRDDALAAAMAEHFDQHPELDPKDAHHLATAMREATKRNPQLWKEVE